MREKIYSFLEKKIDALRKRDKDMDARKRTESEVFDYSTMMTIYKLMNDDKLETIEHAISTGKEAVVFVGTLPNEDYVAVKIYRTSQMIFKSFVRYIEGDPRFDRIKKSHRHLIYTWAKKEYRNLTTAYKCGVRVPKPLFVRNNVLGMELITYRKIPAPLLYQVELSHKRIEDIHRRVIRYMKLMHQKGKIVHGDLSKFNILVTLRSIALIDFAQAVHIQHPMAYELLLRDVENMADYFQSQGVEVSKKEMLKEILEGDI